MAAKLPHDHGGKSCDPTLLDRLPGSDDAVAVADTFKLISDGTRLRILTLLCHAEECVCNIAAAVDMSAPAVSHHLRVLRSAGIITLRKAGKESYYSLADTAEGRLVHRIIYDLFDFKCRR